MPSSVPSEGFRLSWRSSTFLLLGDRSNQLAISFCGLVLLGAVFRDHPSLVSFWAENSLVPVTILSAGLCMHGTFRARGLVRILSGGEVVSARLCKIKADSTGEDMKYHLWFEYAEQLGQTRRFQAVRDVDDLIVGQEFPFLVNRERCIGLLEPDLPGGISFEVVAGLAPISVQLWRRILVVPLLTLIPLLGLLKPVSAFLEQATPIIGGTILFWFPFGIQMIWFFTHRRVFSPGEPVSLGPESSS